MNNKMEVVMGKMPVEWGGKTAKSITFCVTEDCNLACKYCYMTGKNSKRKMNFETARKAVDFILSDREYFNEASVIWDFIGGEPFLEIDLIDKTCDYIKHRMYILEHPWFNSYRFNFSSNGLLYHTPKVQNYIQKNKGHVSIGISVDGNKIKHDMQRVRADGSGSYDSVVKNVQLWLEQFPNTSTKATFAHDDIPYLKDSIISLWDLGIKTVAANVVFEDVWADGDDLLMEQQLTELADYVLENNMWQEYSVRFFDPNIGYPLTEEDMLRNFCGAGKMLAIDCDGNLFPCVRFYDFSLSNRSGLCIGDIYNGINQDKVRPFLGLNLKSQSKEECVRCDVASGCAWCQGNNYDLADSDTIYQRATHLCKMHKATVRANKYFWEKFERATGLTSERKKIENKRNQIRILADKQQFKYMYFITSDNITPHCSYKSSGVTGNIMSRELFEKGIQFCNEKGIIPVMLGRPEFMDFEYNNSFSLVDPADGSLCPDNVICLYNNAINPGAYSENSILLVKRDKISDLFDLVEELFNHTGRINIILEDTEKWDGTDIENYENQLDRLVGFLAESYGNGRRLEVNVLTDIWNLKEMRNCEAGINAFSLAPNGKIYICPAFYFDDPGNHAGILEEGIDIKNKELFQLENAPICSACDVYNCRRCKFQNKKLTNEFNTPSKIQCVISHIERNKSMALQKTVMRQGIDESQNVLKEIKYLDPLDKLLDSTGALSALI